MKSDKVYRYITYILLMILIIGLAIMYRDKEFVNVYFGIWSLSMFATIYPTIYLYNFSRTIDNMFSYMCIVRMERRSMIAYSIFEKNIEYALEFTLVGNVIFVVYASFLYGVFYIRQISAFLISNVISQFLFWIICGSILSLICYITNKIIISYVVTIVILVTLYFGKAASFVFNKYIPTLYDYIYIKPEDLLSMNLYKSLIVELMYTLGLFIVGYILIYNKKIWSK